MQERPPWYIRIVFGIPELFGRLVEGAEWLVHAPLMWFTGGGDGPEASFFSRMVEGAEGLFWAVLTLPLRLFRGAPKELTEEEEQKLNAPDRGGLLNSAEWLFFAIWHPIEHAAVTVWRLLLPEWLRDRAARVAAVFTLPLVLVYVVAEFLGDWWSTRNFRQLLGAIPAFVLGVPMAACMVMAPLYSVGNRKVAHYRNVVREAQEAENEELATLAMSKLEQLGYQRLERMEVLTAMELSRRGDHQGAYQRMLKLVPEGEPGLYAAHMWIAGAAMDGVLDVPNPIALAEHHCRRAMAVQPQAKLATRLLTEIKMARGERSEAIEDLASLVEDFPFLHIDLACHLMDEDPDQAREHARRAIRLFSQHEENLFQLPQGDKTSAAGSVTPDQLGLSADGLGRLAQCYKLAGKAELYAGVLHYGQTHFADQPVIQQSVRMLTDQLSQEAGLQDRNAVAALRRLIAIQPEHRRVMLVLARGMYEREPQAGRLTEALRTNETVWASIEKAVGDHYLVEERYPEAVKHYQAALEVDGKNGSAWNNMAWILSTHDPVDMQRALQCANRAVELMPIARVFETRGQILFKLQQWDAAAVDLEAAINGGLVDHSKVRRKLVQIYERLGQNEQARAHRALLSTS